MKTEFPKKEKVYVIGIHHYCFRSGEPSEIIGVKMGQPSLKSEPRLVYEVEYSDGVRDEICVSEIGNVYKLLTFTDIVKGKYTLEQMKDCFNESRLAHPMVGFKHDTFESYLASKIE